MPSSRSQRRLIQSLYGFIGGEALFENPAHYAVPSAGINWGSLTNEIQFD
jgi:hypothetical protein